MKKLLILIAIIFAMAPVFGQFSKATLQATGLTCAMCSNAINKALMQVPFIQSVKSDIKNSSFNIVFKENSSQDIDAIRKAVEDAGFSVGNLKLTGSFNNISIENDKHIEFGKEAFHFVSVSPQVLNGEQTITIVDKDFLTPKQYKKYSAATKLSCIETGKSASCCAKDGIAANARVYHVTI